MATALQTYLGSKELKKLIYNRSVEFNLPLKGICLENGVNYADFMNAYINSSENKKFEIEEEKFEGILSSLGIEIRHQFIINKSFNYQEKQNQLREILSK